MSAAQNTGSVGGFMGAGIGMGMGAQMGQEFSRANTDAVYCPNCNHQVKNGAKFCSECGTRINPTCPKCKKELPAGTKFCPDCGTKL